MSDSSPGTPEGEEKALFRIGEVSRLTGTKAFVLRYWETEFPALQPVKSASGHRLYRRKDIETVLEIKRLLYEEGFTIAGARRYLGEVHEAGNHPGQEADTESAGTDLVPAHGGPRAGRNRASQVQVLLRLREELAAILTLLKGR
jgi:DNA-binding transcriptional MerR regulator